jgi:hypothetical protein
MIFVLFTGCASKISSDSGGGTDDDIRVTGDATETENNGGGSEESDSDNSASGSVSSTLDTKYVSKDYMLTTLVNSDCTITEDTDGLSFSTTNTLVNISVTPGVQNLSKAAVNMQSLVPSYFTDGQAGEISDGYLFGYRAKLFMMSCTYNDMQCNGMMVLSVINQSLYMMTVVIDEQATTDEFELMKNVISSIVVLAPLSVDSETHTAQYSDPYEDYTNFYSDYDYYDISFWYYLPYEYYAWCDVDYSAWSDETLFEPDWNYYPDENDYWDWGWDTEDDWIFYDDYYAYYEQDYYETQVDYYYDYDEYYDVWDSDFGDYDIYVDYSDDGYYDDGSDDDGSYDDGS